MRTTINLNDSLFRQVKRLAVERHRTFTAVLEDALRELLSRRARQAGPPPTELPVSEGGRGLQAGVDLDHSAALFDLMEGRA